MRIHNAGSVLGVLVLGMAFASPAQADTGGFTSAGPDMPFSPNGVTVMTLYDSGLAQFSKDIDVSGVATVGGNLTIGGTVNATGDVCTTVTGSKVCLSALAKTSTESSSSPAYRLVVWRGPDDDHDSISAPACGPGWTLVSWVPVSSYDNWSTVGLCQRQP